MTHDTTRTLKPTDAVRFTEDEVNKAAETVQRDASRVPADEAPLRPTTVETYNASRSSVEAVGCRFRVRSSHPPPIWTAAL